MSEGEIDSQVEDGQPEQVTLADLALDTAGQQTPEDQPRFPWTASTVYNLLNQKDPDGEKMTAVMRVVDQQKDPRSHLPSGTKAKIILNTLGEEFSLETGVRRKDLEKFLEEFREATSLSHTDGQNMLIEAVQYIIDHSPTEN